MKMKNLKVYLSAIVIVFMFVGATTPEKEQAGSVKWVTWEEAVALSKENPKKIFVDVYTDWCGWCKRMDAMTFEHPIISQYLNDKYYAVKLNAEQRGDIVFQGHTFKFQSSGGRGVHELAAALLQNKMSYPTTVVLNEEFKILQPLPGFKGPEEFDVILKYFGENKFKNSSWEEFTSSYKSPVKK